MCLYAYTHISIPVYWFKQQKKANICFLFMLSDIISVICILLILIVLFLYGTVREKWTFSEANT